MDPEEPAEDAEEFLEESLSGKAPQTAAEKPEADTLEQARPVQGGRVRTLGAARDDVPEADWLEQSVEEPLDEYDQR